MTKFQKQMLTIAAAGALTAVTALPAMALENEFKGSFNVRWTMSNWEAYENYVPPTGWNPVTGGTTNGLTNTAYNIGRYGFSSQRYYYPAINPSMSNYFEQRAVLSYTAKASDKLKLVTAFEIDSRWGDSAYNQDGNGQATTGQIAMRNSGGAIGADKINLETKNVYLDYVCPLTGANVKIGIQPFNDAYKGLLLGPVDMAGILVQKKMGGFTGTAGFFRLNDSITNATSTTGAGFGRYTRDIYAVDAAYAVSKDFSLGMSYYYYKDNTTAALYYTAPAAGVAGPGTISSYAALGGLSVGYNTALHNIGLRTDMKFGKLAVDTGFILQAGNISDAPNGAATVATVGFAAQAGMKYTTDGGQFKTSFLWTSGDNQTDFNNTAWGTRYPRDTKRTAFINVQSQTRESVYTGLTSFILLNSAGRFGGSDRAVTPDMYNFGQGVTAAAVGYDAKFGKGYLNTNAVFLASTANNANDPRHINKLTGERNNSRYIGTELNIEPGYKLYDNLTVYTQFAYAFLGGYFKNGAGSLASSQFTSASLGTNAKSPTDPYSLKIGFAYSF